jgi:arginine-tRNA-protein transferase
MEYSYIPFIQAAEYQELMNQGYRKFGALAFRPVCPSCRACRPIRISVPDFKPDRSQRRARRDNQHLEVRHAPPTVDDTRLDLLHRYQAAQTERKGWPDSEKDGEEYAFSFVENPLPAVEISLWEADRLCAVVLTEVTPDAVSGIYHFYDPELYHQGVGTYCMLRTIDLARELGKPWAYFGYYVQDCPSLAYKARFHPCEVLGEDGVWRPHHKAPEEARSALTQK